jgi:transposase InsO family protein
LDLFWTESILLKTHWVLVVMDQLSRRIIGFGVQAVAVDGVALCRMFNQAISGQGVPARLSLDHDPLFHFQRWQANLRILAIEVVQTVPLVPWSHPFVERLIKSIRTEYLDQLFYWNAADLAQKLAEYQSYYNEVRVHQGLGGGTPAEKAGRAVLSLADLVDYAWQSHCRGCPSPLDQQFAMLRFQARLVRKDLWRQAGNERALQGRRLSPEST